MQRAMCKTLTCRVRTSLLGRWSAPRDRLQPSSRCARPSPSGQPSRRVRGALPRVLPRGRRRGPWVRPRWIDGRQRVACPRRTGMRQDVEALRGRERRRGEQGLQPVHRIDLRQARLRLVYRFEDQECWGWAYLYPGGPHQRRTTTAPQPLPRRMSDVRRYRSVAVSLLVVLAAGSPGVATASVLFGDGRAGLPKRFRARRAPRRAPTIRAAGCRSGCSSGATRRGGHARRSAGAPATASPTRR